MGFGFEWIHVPTAINVWFSHPKDFVQKYFGSTCRGEKAEQEVAILSRNVNKKKV